MYSWVGGEGSQALHRMKTISSGMNTVTEERPRDDVIDTKVSEELAGGEAVQNCDHQYVLYNDGNADGDTKLQMRRRPEDYSTGYQRAEGDFEGDVQDDDGQYALESRTDVNKAGVSKGQPGSSTSQRSASSSHVLVDAHRTEGNHIYPSTGCDERLQSEQRQTAVKDGADVAELFKAMRQGAWKRGGVRLNRNGPWQRMSTMTRANPRTNGTGATTTPHRTYSQQGKTWEKEWKHVELSAMRDWHQLAAPTTAGELERRHPAAAGIRQLRRRRRRHNSRSNAHASAAHLRAAPLLGNGSRTRVRGAAGGQLHGARERHDGVRIGERAHAAPHAARARLAHGERRARAAARARRAGDAVGRRDGQRRRRRRRRRR
ncbi:hypothetical protein FGB62_127g16 [Gracilaria domingensis]|nr:hypothetical protein FGB62_127g16 [Gracilaria domingensis]